MNRRIAALTLAALLAVVGRAPAQDSPRSQAADPEQGLRISPGLSFREITLFLKNGTIIWGRLLGASSEAVRVRQGGEDLDVPFRDLREVVIKREKNVFASRGVAPGMALGLYVGSGLTLGAFQRPGFYLASHVEVFHYAVPFFFVNALCVATGGALGWIAGSGSLKKAFVFPEDPEEGRESRELSFLSEPDRRAYSYDEDSFSSTEFTQTFRAPAFYGIVSLEPLRPKAAGRLTWNVGLGFGLAAVRVLRQGYEYGWDDPVEETAEVKKTLFSAVAFSAFEFRLTRSLSAGIGGDYAFIPAVAVPGLPLSGLPAQDLGLGNASVGFVLGIHF